MCKAKYLKYLEHCPDVELERFSKFSYLRLVHSQSSSSDIYFTS